jgi:CRISPR-associated endonuclease/helicase Cas3
VGLPYRNLLLQLSHEIMPSPASKFASVFEKLTGNPPFPWQEDIYRDWFSQRRIPTRCNLGTGLGKTSVIAVWLIALALHGNLPRRLVYVVNRRTVVDQTTDEVTKLRKNLLEKPELQELRNAIAKLCAGRGEEPLAISTLRGQFADNREWSTDPSRPAVIVGTVDMIGSRLLFSGYGVGFKARPLHAGFLGQDALIVHDEAHLEPAFQTLLERLEKEQRHCNEFRYFHVMELTATTRGGNGENEEPCKRFELTEKEKHPPEVVPEPTQDEPPIHIVWRRLKATKQLELTAVQDEKGVAARIAAIAKEYADSGTAVLVFLRTLEAVNAVRQEIEKTTRPVVPLTGTMRGKERDGLVELPDFQRFRKDAAPGETVYLICTSAGEVGIDISADHMVCDLSTFESMSQRFGRVNRYGMRRDSRITVVYPTTFDPDHKLASYRQATLRLLQRLSGDASPKALGDLAASLTDQERDTVFAPAPEIPHATNILFDAWALTSIRKAMPGRPPVEPYLHGIAEWQPPETHVAWRQEVEEITGNLLALHPPEELLDDYPLLPHELLRDRSDRVFKQIDLLAKKNPNQPAWLIDARGEVEATTLDRLTAKEQIEGKTLLLPPKVGGLSRNGMLDASSDDAEDVADALLDKDGKVRRQRIWDEEIAPPHLRIIRTIDTRPDSDNSDEPEKYQRRFWHWFDQPLEGGRTSNERVFWDVHVNDVIARAKEIVARLDLPKDIAEAIVLAAVLHDHGKKRGRFQLSLGNRNYPDQIWAKSKNRVAALLPETFRHEFASTLDALADPGFSKLSPQMQDLVLHLIAAHHGRARPHFTPDEALDPERLQSDAESLTFETPRRFARLQLQYGRWGLAYLESILRAADWAASAGETESVA